MPGFLGFNFAGTAAPSPSPNPNVNPEPLEEEDDTRREINAVLNDVMPWMVSLLFHLGLIILAFFLIWAAMKEVKEEKIVVPMSTLGDTPGAPLSLTTPKELTEESSSKRTRSQNLVRPSSAVSADTPTDILEHGIAGASEALSSPFGTGNRPGEGFSVGMFGNSGNAKTIVYVIDSSGSMIDTMPFVIDELKRSISGLSEQQKFNVVFYQNGKHFEVHVPKKGMKTADAATKSTVIEWIDLSAGNVVPGGVTDPKEAIQLALRYDPELVYLLSDNIIGRGKYGLHPDVLIEFIKSKNTKPSKINTIQFYYPDPLASSGQKGTLERISDETGGVYKFVDGRELGGR